MSGGSGDTTEWVLPERALKEGENVKTVAGSAALQEQGIPGRGEEVAWPGQVGWPYSGAQSSRRPGFGLCSPQPPCFSWGLRP